MRKTITTISLAMLLISGVALAQSVVSGSERDAALKAAHEYITPNMAHPESVQYRDETVTKDKSGTMTCGIVSSLDYAGSRRGELVYLYQIGKPDGSPTMTRGQLYQMMLEDPVLAKSMRIMCATLLGR